jgi:hypothetical protein
LDFNQEIQSVRVNERKPELKIEEYCHKINMDSLQLIFAKLLAVHEIAYCLPILCNPIEMYCFEDVVCIWFLYYFVMLSVFILEHLIMHKHVDKDAYNHSPTRQMRVEFRIGE